jgi:hypothetical protein
MIILSTHTPKVLIPVPKSSWMTSSQAQPKDHLGNENKTLFRIQAKLHDGYVKWAGWFNDRDDADEFMWAALNNTLILQKNLWTLCTPNWNPDIGENVVYHLATQVFLSTSPNTLQTYSKPIDWNNNSNTIEGIGGGAGGCYADTPTASATDASGGGGGAYSKITNFTFSGASVSYQIGRGGPTGTGGANSTAGGDTWFNSATFPGAGSDNTKLGAKGGSLGTKGSGNAGGAGGAAASGWGQVKYSGGRGGSLLTGGTTSYNRVTGGGGAAGLNGNGINGADSSASNQNVFTAGGGGDAGFGGAGATTNGGNGSPGTEWSASYGSGGGGAGGRGVSGGGGDGGLYGAGGGSTGGFTNAPTGAGSQGLLVVTYSPPKVGLFNSPMLGM